MPKIIKLTGYLFLFVFSFFLFLYLTFPYDVLKERLIAAASQQLGSDYDVKIGDLSPGFITGTTLKNIKIVKYDAGSQSTVWEAQKVKIGGILGSALFGRTSIDFFVKNQKSEVEGNFRKTEEGFSFSGDFSDFNVGDFGLFSGGGGAKLVSAIDGTIRLNVNRRQITQSSGTADLSLSGILLKPGELKIGEGGSYTVPELVLSKRGGSLLKMELSRGVIRVKEFRLQDGDLVLDLNGDIFMSSTFKNYRMNLRGTFSVSQKLEQAVPLLFMVEKQRQPDGTYPITITGRIEQPSIKIGDIPLPF